MELTTSDLYLLSKHTPPVVSLDVTFMRLLLDQPEGPEREAMAALLYHCRHPAVSSAVIAVARGLFDDDAVREGLLNEWLQEWIDEGLDWGETEEGEATIEGAFLSWLPDTIKS